MTRRKLNQEEIESALAGLSGWQMQDGKLHKTFKFDSFARAMGWMMSVAILRTRWIIILNGLTFIIVSPLIWLPMI